MTWALAVPQKELANPSARHVLLVLANYAGPGGRGAFPSAATLSEDTGLSERTVRLKLAELREAGLIVEGNQAIAAAYIDQRDRRPVVYDLQLGKFVSGLAEIERGANAAPRKKRGAAKGTGCSSQQNGVQLKDERGAAAAPNPSLIQKQEEEDAPEPSPQPLSDPRQRFAMFVGWTPPSRDLEAQAYLRGVALDQVTPERLAKFIAFHISKLENVDTNSGWAYRLVDWMHRDITQGAAAHAKSSTGQKRRPGGITLEQNLGDTSFADGVEPT